jgi:hypothetical protein
MNSDELVAIVERLDESVPKENAKVRLYQYGGDGEDGFMVATRNGYLRFGIELLKAGAAAPTAERMIDVDLQYLIDEDSSINFSTFERVEELGPEPNENSWGDSLFIYTVITILIATPILAVIGLIALIRWFL